VEQRTIDPAGAAISFEVTARGGRPPTTLVCTPPSGSTFRIGETAVSCTATDAQSQTSACNFTVSVTRIPELARTRFLAFGDSITEGQTSPARDFLMTLDFPDAYPGRLEQMLAARYAAQTITVINRGVGGERAARGRQRLPDVLDEDRPEVLLLLEGVNNIANEPTRQLAGYLDEMVREAQERHVDVLIATLLPVGDEWEARRPGTREAVRNLNEEIEGIARKNGLAAPVDLYSVFLQEPSLIGSDGLHPTPAGYVRMAEVFFEAIRAQWEIGLPSFH
jgi:lysophospholipase L1-like esterase